MPSAKTAWSRRFWQATLLTLLVLGYAGYYLCRSNLSVAAPLIAAEADSTPSKQSAMLRNLADIVSAGTAAYALGKFIGGPVGDRLGGRTVFLLGMAAAAGCTVLFASSTAPMIFLLAWTTNRFLQAFGWGGMVKLVGPWFGAGSLHRVMAVLSLSFLFGDFMARAFMGQVLAAGYGWREMFLLNASLLGGFWLLTFLLLPQSPEAVGQVSETPAEPSYSPAVEEKGQPSHVMRRLLGNPLFLCACGMSVAATLLREALLNWSPTYFTASLRLAPAKAAQASAWFPFWGGISVLLCGGLADFIGRRGRTAIFAVGLAGTAALLLLLALPLPMPAASRVFLISAVGFCLTGPYSYLAGAMALDLGGQRAAATAAGLIDGFGYLGGVLSGSILIRFVQSYGWENGFLLLATIALAAVLLALGYGRLERRSPS